MNGATLRYIEQAIEDTEPEPAVIILAADHCTCGSITCHWECNPVTCIAAAYEAMDDYLYDISEPECSTCGGPCTL